MDNLFNLKETEAFTFLEDVKKTNDGLLRPKLEEGKDGKREFTIRILPNLSRDGKIHTTAIEKHLHYADFPNNPQISGYYDCLKNKEVGKECPLCTTYWALHNAGQDEKKKLISRSSKYYAYVLVTDDEQVPENVGKIFIYPFGYKLYQKIEMAANRKKKAFHAEDLIYGANLNVIIQKIGGFYNYDASYFDAPEPITIDDKQLEVGADGKISKAESNRVKDFLLSREFEMDNFIAKDWTEAQYKNVETIVSILTNSNYTAETVKQPTLTSSDVFNDVDDEIVEEVVKAKSENDVDTTVESAKKKASAFFDDED